MTFPTLTQAVGILVDEVMQASKDKLVRIDCGTEFDVQDLIEVVGRDGERRIGITSPIKLPRGGRTRHVASDARQITRWRNEPIARRRATPLVILGHASGRDEAGLRRCPTVLSEQDILRQFRKVGSRWLIEHTEGGEAPPRLFTAIVDMALEGSLGIEELGSYCDHAFAPPSQAHLRPQKELWRLGLIPDAQAMDGDRPGVRLSMNLDLRETLVSAPSSSAEDRRRARLTHAAESGNLTARAALEFAATRKVEFLKGMDLGELLLILDTRVETDDPPTGLRGGGLYDALQTSVSREDLAAIGVDWNPAEREFNESVDIDGKKFAITLQRDDGDDPEGEDEDDDEGGGSTSEASEEPLFVMRIDGGESTESPQYSGQNLIADAITLDQLANTGGVCRSLAEAFVEARDNIVPLALWGKHLLEVLILAPQEREHVESYLSKWRALVDYVLNLEDQAHSGLLRLRLSHLDGEWEYRRTEDGSELVEGRLMPIHPFVLAPHLEISQYAIDNIGKADLADQIKWAQDRSIPAYPAVWIGDRTLLHRGGRPWAPEFAAKTPGARPPVNTPRGIVDLVRAYIGVHPYAALGVNILLVDPPEGAGITSALRQIRQKSLARATNVSTVLWHADALPWDPGAWDINNMGRIQDLPTWVANQRLRFNMIFVFGRPRTAHAGGSHQGSGGPSRGLQNALTVTVMPAPMIQDAGASYTGDLVPCVSIQPRESHDVVQLMMRLARWSDKDDRYFEVRPLLHGKELDLWSSFGQLSDWLAFAAPSPIGLIPPLSLGTAGLTFLGREELGSYALFVYARDLYAIRKKVVTALKSAPIAPQSSEVERQLEKLALAVPNGVLRLGRGGPNIINSQIGLIVASHIASQMQ